MSEQDRIAFEAWYDNDISEPLPDDYTILGKRYLYMGWQAATTEANKRIAQLESEIAELKDRLHEIALDWQVNQAHINVLREALENLHDDIAEYQKLNNISGYENNCMKQARQALASTPAQSLQAHDNEVIEKCAKECDSYFERVVVRALKGKYDRICYS